MLLSVVVYKHKLTAGQWLGTGIVFAGISVEAWVKRKGENILLQPAAGSPPLSSRGELTISLQTSTLSASRKRRRRQRSRNYSLLDLGPFVVIIPIVIHRFPFRRNTSAEV